MAKLLHQKSSFIVRQSRKSYSSPKWFERVRPEGAHSLKPFNLTNKIGLLYIQKVLDRLS